MSATYRRNRFHESDPTWEDEIMRMGVGVIIGIIIGVVVVLWILVQILGGIF